MVVVSPTPVRIQKIDNLPVIDISLKRSLVAELVAKASEDYGFFKVVNHGASKDVIDRMEEEGLRFFAKPALEKILAGPPNPLGYGTKNIGCSGDVGEVEYLLLPTHPQAISQASKSISNDPTTFNCVVNDYIGAVRNLACEILELMTEGLQQQGIHDIHNDKDKYVLSNFIRNADNDSLIRLNHYPPYKDQLDTHQQTIGFGEHSDPQILTILRSNDVGGLQILLEDGLWVPVSPDPMAFCVIVGDSLQVLTNGRFKRVIHRAMTNSSYKPRMSIVYFGAPSLQAWISPLPDFVRPPCRGLYRPFTWSEYKKKTYTLRLGDSRLHLFNSQIQEET